jgi:glycosyltransferase involved in cell wall biosynthesis
MASKSSPYAPANGRYSKGAFSVILPYYNEADFLEKTLSSWLMQTRRPDQIILIDNASTDGSVDIAKHTLAGVQDIDIVYLQEARPGKVHALETGCRAITGEFAVTSDADTRYPPHYLQLCEQLFSGSDETTAALMALPEGDHPEAYLSRIRRRYFIALHKLFRKHTFTGGYGQIFRTEALARAGGFSEKNWPHVLMDHEIMYRLFKFARSCYHIDLWCQSSQRRQDRRRVRWNLLERILYLLTPHSFQGWFFHRFLGRRFSKRGLNHLRLRERPWQTADTSPK